MKVNLKKYNAMKFRKHQLNRKGKWVQKHYNKFSKAPLNLVILDKKDLEFYDSSFKQPRRYARISQYTQIGIAFDPNLIKL